MTVKDFLPPFDVATLGAVATSRPDINSRLLHAFYLQVIGTGNPTAADYLEYVTLNQDNRQKILIKPADQANLDAINNANGDNLDPSILVINLTRPGMLFSPWGTNDIQSLTIQAKIVAANPAGKTLTKIQGFYGYTPVSVPQNRGDAYLQTVIPVALPVAGWNILANLPVNDIITATKMILAANPITEVRISVGDKPVYHLTKAAAAEGLRRNPMYKIADAPTFFPVILDDMGIPSDFIPLLENGVRRPVNVEFYWDTTIAAVSTFNILLEGIEKGTPMPVANSKA